MKENPRGWVTSRESIGLSPAALAKLAILRETGMISPYLSPARKVFVELDQRCGTLPPGASGITVAQAEAKKRECFPPKLARMMVNLAELPSRGVCV